MSRNVQNLLYYKAINQFSSAVERTGLEGVYWGAIPVIGVIPSSMTAVYAAARAVDRLAVFCFQSVKHEISEKTEDSHQYTQNLKEAAIDYLSVFVGATIGSLTMGAAYFALLSYQDIDALGSCTLPSTNPKAEKVHSS